MAEMFRSGASPAEIGEQYGMTPQNVYRILYNYGLGRMSNAARRNRQKAIAKRYDEVRNSRIVAREFGMSRQTVCHAAKLYGVEMRRVGRPSK